MTQSSRAQHLPALTGLRGVAAAAVLIFHLWQFAGGPQFTVPGVGYPLHALAAAGWLGVDLFFVLSGFLLSQPFLAANAGLAPWPAIPVYVLRRVRRVIPALWLQIAVLLVLGLAWDSARDFGISAALVHGLFLAPWVRDPAVINPVYWSLPVEWWFYFMLPVVCWVLGRSRWWLVLALVLVSVLSFRALCYEWLIEQRTGVFAYPSIIGLGARWDQFTLGILAALAHRHVDVAGWQRAWAFWVGIAALVAFVPWLITRGDIYVRVDYPYLLVHQTWVALLLAMVVFGAAGANSLPTRLLGSRVLRWIGAISFSLYLWHYPVLEMMQRQGLFDSLGTPMALLLALAISISVAWASWRVAELPFQRDRRE